MNDTTLRRSVLALAVLALVLLVVVLGRKSSASRPDPLSYRSAFESTPAAPATPRAAPSHSIPLESDVPAGYQTLMANVWVGKKLWLKSDFAYIGEISGIEDDHLFPDGTTRDGVRIRFHDGTQDWIPRKTVQLLYWTKP